MINVVLYNWYKTNGGVILETKREKFLRLANSRTNKLLDSIRLLANLSNKSNYDYTKADVDKIFNAIDKELKRAKIEFDSIKKNSKKFKI